MFISPNDSVVTLKLTRHEVCQTILALDCVVQTPGTSPEYPELHRKVQSQLNEHDQKLGKKYIPKD